LPRNDRIRRLANESFKYESRSGTLFLISIYCISKGVDLYFLFCKILIRTTKEHQWILRKTKRTRRVVVQMSGKQNLYLICGGQSPCCLRIDIGNKWYEVPYKHLHPSGNGYVVMRRKFNGNQKSINLAQQSFFEVN